MGIWIKEPMTDDDDDDDDWDDWSKIKLGNHSQTNCPYVGW
jgi:hypothetical protein